MTTPEFTLAVDCCRYNFSGNGGDRQLHIPSGVDWRRFLRLVRRHRIEALAARALHHNHISPPAAIAEALAGDAAATAEANLRSARECLRLLAAFSEAKVPILFVKGLTVSALAYGDPLVKMSADTDILVDPGDLEPAARLLEGLDYRLAGSAAAGAGSTTLSAWHGACKESGWYNQSSGVTIELHTRLADNTALIPGIGLESPRQQVAIGAGASLPTLADDDLFAYLCVHGASSAWFRLKWIADLAGLLSASQRGVESLYRASRALGAGRAPAQALLLAERLFGLGIPQVLLAELRSDAFNRALASIAYRQLREDEEPTRRRLGTASIHLSQLLLEKSWPFKLSEVGRQFRAWRLVAG